MKKCLFQYQFTHRMRSMVLTLSVLFFLGSCSKEIAPLQQGNESNSTQARTVSANKKFKPIVTWDYLRAMSAATNNPSITEFLKRNNQLLPKDLSGARGGTSNCDPWNPDPSKCGPSTIDHGPLTSMRLDLSLVVNGQPMILSVVVVYDSQTHQIHTAGASLYGAGTPQSYSNYTNPVASYNSQTGQIEFIGNLGYQYNSGTERQIGASAGASGSIGTAGVDVSINGSQTNIHNVSSSGVIYTQFSIDPNSHYGNASVQVNGTHGPRWDYQVVPTP